MVISTGDLQRSLLPLARRVLGLPATSGSPLDECSTTSEELGAARVAIRQTDAQSDLSKDFLVPLDELVFRAGLLARASDVISTKAPKLVEQLWKAASERATEVSEDGSSEIKVAREHTQLIASLTRDEALIAESKELSGVDYVARLLHLGRATRARCLGHDEARTVPSAVSLDEQTTIGFMVPVEGSGPISWSESTASSLESAPDAAQLRTLASVILLSLPTALERRRFIRDLSVFAGKEPLDWSAVRARRHAMLESVGAESPKQVATKVVKRERLYRWSVPLHGVEGSKGGDHQMWVQDKTRSDLEVLQEQRSQHLEQFDRVMLSHAGSSPVAAAMVALATGDQKLLRLVTIAHMKHASVIASGTGEIDPAKTAKGDPLESGAMVGRNTATSLPAVDDDTSGSEGEVSDGQLGAGSPRSPTLDMGFYKPSTDAPQLEGRSPAPSQLPKFSRLHASTDRMAGMPAPPQWLRWIGLVQADGSLADAGHYHAYRSTESGSTDSGGATEGIDTSDLPALLGRVRVRSSMVRSVDSAIKTVQLESREVASASRSGSPSFSLRRVKPSAAMVAIRAAIERSQSVVSIDEVRTTEAVRASRREKRQKQEAVRSKMVADRIRKRRNHVVAMLRLTLRPFGRAAVRGALDPVVEAHAQARASYGSDSPLGGTDLEQTVGEAETKALLEMQPLLGPAFRPMYPILRSILRELTVEDLDSLHRARKSDSKTREGGKGAAKVTGAVEEPSDGDASAAWRDARIPASGTLDNEWSETLQAASREQQAHSIAIGDSLAEGDGELPLEGEHEPAVELDVLSGEAENMLDELLLEVEMEMSFVGENEGMEVTGEAKADGADSSTAADTPLGMDAVSPEQAKLCRKLVLLLPPSDLLKVCKQLRQAKRNLWSREAFLLAQDRVRQRLGANAIAVESALSKGLLRLEATTLERFALEHYGRRAVVHDVYDAMEAKAEAQQLVRDATSGWAGPASGVGGVAGLSSTDEDDDDDPAHEALLAWRADWAAQHGKEYDGTSPVSTDWDQPESVECSATPPDGASGGASQPAAGFARRLSESLFPGAMPSDDPMDVLDAPIGSSAHESLDEGALAEEQEGLNGGSFGQHQPPGSRQAASVDVGMVGPAAYVPGAASSSVVMSSRDPSPFHVHRDMPQSLQSPDILGVVRAPLRLEARLVHEKVMRKLSRDRGSSPLGAADWQLGYDDGIAVSEGASGHGLVPSPCHDGHWSEDVEMRTVLVEGVPPGATPQQLKASLRGLGEVQSVRFVGARTQAMLRAVRERILRRAMADLQKADRQAAEQGREKQAEGRRPHVADKDAAAAAAALDGDLDDGPADDDSADLDHGATQFRTSHAMQARNDGRKALVRRVAWAQKRSGRGKGGSVLNEVPPLLLAFDTAIEARYGPVQRVLGERNLPLSVYNEPAPSIPTPSDAALPAVQPQTHRKGLGKLLRHEVTQIERIVRTAPSHAFVTFADAEGAAAAANPEIRIFGVVVGQTACRIRPAEGKQVVHVGNLPAGVTPLSLQLQLNSVLKEAGVSVGLKRARKLPEHVVSADTAMLSTSSLRDALVLEQLLSKVQLRPGKNLQVSYCSEQDWIQAGKRLHAPRI